MPSPNTLLKMAIWQSGLTQAVIAERAGLHESRLSKIVRGHVDATADERKRLSKALRRPVHDLGFGERLQATA